MLQREQALQTLFRCDLVANEDEWGDEWGAVRLPIQCKMTIFFRIFDSEKAGKISYWD